MSIAKSAYYGTGRRKRAIARVFVKSNSKGIGSFTVKQAEAKAMKVGQYFPELSAVEDVCKPLSLLGLQKESFDIYVTVTGGGKSGQKGAVRLGLARALVDLEGQGKESPEANDSASGFEELVSWRYKLRKAGELTRDSRRVERKKYGLHKARKRAPLVKR